MFNRLAHHADVLGSVATSSLAAWCGCLVVSDVPQLYLEYPNTGEGLFESARILDYLNAQYG